MSTINLENILWLTRKDYKYNGWVFGKMTDSIMKDNAKKYCVSFKASRKGRIKHLEEMLEIKEYCSICNEASRSWLEAELIIQIGGINK